MSNYKKFHALGDDPSVHQKITSESVGHIESRAHKEKLIRENEVVLVDIYGDWCGPCKMIEPRFNEMAQKYSRPGICILIKEDVDANITEGIKGVPMFQFYHQGKYHSHIMGADIDKVEATLMGLLSTQGQGGGDTRHRPQIRR